VGGGEDSAGASSDPCARERREVAARAREVARLPKGSRKQLTCLCLIPNDEFTKVFMTLDC
jgi:hypothetical protein